MVARAKRGMALWGSFVLTAMTCAAQIPFFTPASATATVKELHGQVSVLRENYPWALHLGATIQPQQMILSGADGYAKLEVSDGSTLEVFPNSKVQFRSNPGNLKDLVDVILGRIRVHIEKIGGQPNHNSVHTPTAVISVRGTTFDVVVNDDESTLVAVVEGQVAVRHALKPSKDERLLNPGEVLRVYKNEPLAKRGVDRGAIAARVFRSLEDALITVIRNGGLGGGSGTGPAGGGPTLPGDTQGNPPPPPPPPPPSN